MQKRTGIRRSYPGLKLPRVVQDGILSKIKPGKTHAKPVVTGGSHFMLKKRAARKRRLILRNGRLFLKKDD